MSQTKYLGYGRYENTGQFYRVWQFTEAVPELKALKGNELIDNGPRAERRFSVWDGTHKHRPEAETVLKCFPFVKNLPWRPPREGEGALTKAIEGLNSHLASLNGHLARQTLAEKTLEEMKATLENVHQGENPKPPSTTENRYLRLKFDGKYDNGDPYKDFELLADAPEIPADRSDVEPRHAIKGDVLRERYDDELTPFELRRNGKRIGDPEWWQVRHLFIGLHEGQEGESPEPETADPGLEALLTLIPWCWRFTDTYEVTEAIEGTLVRKGDFLLKAGVGASSRIEETKRTSRSRASIVSVPRRHFPTIAEHVNSLRFMSSMADRREVLPFPRLCHRRHVQRGS